MTRRRFLARAAAFGVAASTLGTVLEACGGRPQTPGPPRLSPAGGPRQSQPGGTSPDVMPLPAFGGTPPVIAPTPVSVAYGEMLEASAIIPVAMPSGALRGLLEEVAADAGIPLVAVATGGRRVVRLTVAADDPAVGSQAYRLEVVPAVDGPAVAIRAGDEAGAYQGLLALTQLAVAQGSTRWLRAASVADAPGFARRGAILDPWDMAAGGPTDESRALLLGRVRFGVRYRLNFVDLPDRTPWPALVRFCDDHHVELMVGKGYRDWLTATPRGQVKDDLAAQLDAGARSIALCWDDIATTNPETLARAHLEVFLDLYEYLRRTDPAVRVSAVLPPYGGIPGRMLVGSARGDGERYLAVMKAGLPADVRVFWTGDGGVFSSTVTTAGARSYADAIGHELGLWDNDTIRFSRARRPCSGRAADLSSVVHAYMGNLVGEASWGGTDGEFALLTSLFYTWNPAAYQPGPAAAVAERILAGGTQ
jgi:hypothetical protein